MTGPETPAPTADPTPTDPTPTTDPRVESLLRWRATISKGVGLVVFALVVLWFVLGPESTVTLLTIALVLMVALLVGQLVVRLIVRSRTGASRDRARGNRD